MSGDEKAPGPRFDGERPDRRWLTDNGWHTEFRAWDDMIVPLGRAVAMGDPRVGIVHAVRDERPASRE
ncbi:hypothetical protein [Nocardia caishijiensis]|uniref:hypothetical protein n=1 Tax=Nocardia caishijiensis TaxID=184756 RepID=UPI00082CA8ED|nr:hypothetical protein [Nocardia caishijiensis]